MDFAKKRWKRFIVNTDCVYFVGHIVYFIWNVVNDQFMVGGKNNVLVYCE